MGEKKKKRKKKKNRFEKLTINMMYILYQQYVCLK